MRRQGHDASRRPRQLDDPLPVVDKSQRALRPRLGRGERHDDDRQAHRGEPAHGRQPGRQLKPTSTVRGGIA